MSTSKTARSRPKLPTGHLPVEWPFQIFSADLVDYKSESVSTAGVKYEIVLSRVDHLTSFTILRLIPKKNS